MMDLATKSLAKKVAILLASFISLSVILALGARYIAAQHHNENEFVVVGSSMIPTFTNGDRVTIHPSAKPKNDEIVIFNHPDAWPIDHDEFLIKRIRAVETDTIGIQNQSLTVNGEEILDLKDYPACDGINDFTYTLGKGEIFAVGDNYRNSIDSLRLLCANIDNPKISIINISNVEIYGTATKKDGVWWWPWA